MSARSTKRFIVALLMAAEMIASGGCGGSDRGKVRGTVLHKDGSAVSRARVVARSDTGTTAHGTTDEKGYIEFEGEIAPGNYDVSILEDRGDPDNRRPSTIAAKYRDATTSGIKITVKAGEATQLDLKLDSP